MPLRRLAATALVASLAFAAPGRSAPPPQIVDATGDGRVPGDGTDIVSALFETEGTTQDVDGRDVYTPDSLAVTVTYAGAVSRASYVAHVVTFEAPRCGEVYLEVYAGGTYGGADCLATTFQVATTVRGRTLTFVLPFGVVGHPYLRPGDVLDHLLAYTAPGDPLRGNETNEVARLAGSVVTGRRDLVEATIDSASTGATFRIA